MPLPWAVSLRAAANSSYFHSKAAASWGTEAADSGVEAEGALARRLAMVRRANKWYIYLPDFETAFEIPATIDDDEYR